jgi:hypothetical protein
MLDLKLYRILGTRHCFIKECLYQYEVSVHTFKQTGIACKNDLLLVDNNVIVNLHCYNVTSVVPQYTEKVFTNVLVGVL